MCEAQESGATNRNTPRALDGTRRPSHHLCNLYPPMARRMCTSHHVAIAVAGCTISSLSLHSSSVLLQQPHTSSSSLYLPLPLHTPKSQLDSFVNRSSFQHTSFDFQHGPRLCPFRRSVPLFVHHAMRRIPPSSGAADAHTVPSNPRCNGSN